MYANTQWLSFNNFCKLEGNFYLVYNSQCQLMPCCQCYAQITHEIKRNITVQIHSSNSPPTTYVNSSRLGYTTTKR